MFNENIKVDMAENGKEAIALIQKNDYDLVIMDIQMPVMNGYETTRFIRSEMNNEKNKIPILGLSAHALEKEREKCLSFGMNDFISKPFNPNVLFNKILNLTGRNQNPAEQTEKFVPETLLVNDKYKSIDLVFLTKTYKGNFEKVKNILSIYLNTIPQQIKDLNNQIELKNVAKIKISAHTLKTSFRYLGVEKLYKLFKDIEIQAGNGLMTEDMIEKWKFINLEWHEVEKEIADFIFT
jgi:CheY-like chemotaxis protein